MEGSRRREFLTRWALLGLALVISTVLGVMKYYRDAQLPFDDFRPRWHRFAILDFVLVWIPMNGIYIVGSLHCHVTNSWHDHRFTWMVAMILSIAWGVIFCGQALAR